MHRYPNPFLTTISKLAQLLAWLAFASAVQAGVPDPFHAVYQGYRGGNHVANAEFSLTQRNGKWVWYMQTEPIGFYRWLTSKKPFEETRMIDSGNGLQLEQLYRGDYPERSPEQSSWFDQRQGVIHFSDSEKNRQAQLNIDGPVYSNHSIHLLYTDMKNNGEQRNTVRFFKKGNLLDATLELEQDVELSHGSRQFPADRLRHRLAGSNKELVYYYAGHDIAPLCIEQYKNGELSNRLWRVSLGQP